MSNSQLSSDLSLDASKFDYAKISKTTAQFNEALIQKLESGPKWYEVGAEKYRQMRWNGETPLPKPKVIESGEDFNIPSRDSGREIPCRMFKPADGQVKGVFMHIHGGGWVLQDINYQDGLLKFHADNCGLAVISVGYRLAPENPFPAAPEDCFDAAEYLVENAKSKYGGDLCFIGGESAGGHLSVLTALHLLKTKPTFALRGLLLHFGAYDLSLLPSVHHFDKPLVLDKPIIDHYLEAFVPNTSLAQRRDPSISPFYADLRDYGRGKLPPALFTCGTEDPLLDDSMMMAAKWMSAGNDAVVRIYTGAPHGYILYPPGACESVEEGLEAARQFILEKL
ncbi:uncharacterized protein K452DRAFT_269286 [Aplosporella prunicola CBS 121167]|uniref:Alpha/beta hydrolase fold-3 domain-containing protein n=1 Tax=Aplosporella prunicola CBS 121167 TaxID=1176127 RepID=A0A6A6BH92_9PEZI|nr:uncharacterized protein K452DRAFT_269286 [Aplosporella prunicola CBS 121167]KAF2142813.1 hypothetical protein K452DRAFT_269286 [Aplosporella prunicola CBS 121167]